MGPVPLWKPILFEAVMILLTALATLLETAAEALSDNRLERLSEEGDIRAVKLRPRLKKLEERLPAVELLPRMVMLAAGFGAAAGFIGPVYGAAVNPAVGTAVMAGILAALFCLIHVLGIRLPRRLATRRIDQAAMRLFRPVEWVSALLMPVYRFNALMVRGILRLMRVEWSETNEKVTEDEIMAMVDMGEEKGGIETNEKEMIENIFEFNNMTAEDCMTHRTNVTAIDIDITDAELVEVIERTGLSRFPVYGKDIDDILGVLTTRDYLLNARREAPKTLRELIRPAYFVPESVRTDVLFREMQTRKTHMAIVVDEYGGTSGLITMEDLLEEIVGNIYDEFDPLAEQDIVKLPDGSWKVAGSVELERLCEEMGIEQLDDEEYDTLGGLVFSQLTAIPEDGSHPEVECFGLHIRVEELSDRRVEWANVRRMDAREDGQEE